MIHVGAAAGRQMLKCFPKNFANNPVVQRTMIAVGAGAGVAAAFKAPFAGIMFVVEELAASMMSLRLVTCSLIGNTVAFFTVVWRAYKPQHCDVVCILWCVCSGD